MGGMRGGGGWKGRMGKEKEGRKGREVTYGMFDTFRRYTFSRVLNFNF